MILKAIKHQTKTIFNTSNNICKKIYKFFRTRFRRNTLTGFIILLAVFTGIFIEKAAAVEPKVKMQKQKAEQYIKGSPATTTTTAPKLRVKNKQVGLSAPRPAANLIVTIVNPDHQALMSQAGIAQDDWESVEIIIAHEDATWCPTRSYGMPADQCPAQPTNTSGPYGLGQANPGTKMASYGSDWATNPVTQLLWLKDYVKRYGGFHGAAQYRLSHNGY